MNYYAVIETKQNGRNIKERSQNFTNQLASSAWLASCVREAKALKIKVVDHYLASESVQS